MLVKIIYSFSLKPAQLQQQLARLGEANAAWAIGCERYQKRLGELRGMLAEAGDTAAPQTFNERRALELLRDVP